MKPIHLYKSLSKGLQSYHGTKEWRIGKWYKAKGELSMCENGFHASEKIFNAMSFVPMECLAKVEVKGNHLEQDDKQCWSEMMIVKAWKWEKKDSVALAIYAATLVIDNYERVYPKDKRPREAINAARKWLKNPTSKNKDAAKSAANAAWIAAKSAANAAWIATVHEGWSAARSGKSVTRNAARSAAAAAWNAARSTESVAWNAAWNAAWSAAKSAAWSAESVSWSMESAARSVVIKKTETWIKKRINKLEEIK